MEINVWILLFVIIFMLHNLEEIISVEKWLQKTYPRVRSRVPSFIQKELDQIGLTTERFAVVVFVVSILASVLLLISVLTEQYYLFFGISFFFALNIFTHPLQSLLLRCYTPGVLTSVVLIIPYYSFFFYQLYHSKLLTLPTFLGAILVMIFIIPAFLVSHKIGEKWSE